MEMQGLSLLSRWSFAFTRKTLEEVLRRLKHILMTSPERRLHDVAKKVVVTSVSDQSTTSLEPKLRRLAGVFATFFCVGWVPCLLNEKNSFELEKILSFFKP